MCLITICSTFTYAQFSGADNRKLVIVQPLQFEYETTLVEAVGSAQAKRSVTLFPSVTDEVKALYFIPGQQVNKDDVLVELDAKLQDVAINRAKIQLLDAQRNFERVTQSLNKGAVTQRDVDDSDTLLRLARVSLDEALANKEDRLIRAPFSGIVGLTDVEVGDRVTPQTQITTLDDRNQLFVNFSAPEQAVGYLLSSPQVTLEPWTERSQKLSAKVTELDSRVSEQDRTIRARAVMDNSSDVYRPGMSFRVSLKIKGERFFAIPEVALSWGASGAFVWLADDATARKVSVQVKQRLRGRILVSGNLKDSKLLVVEGIQGLREGQSLSIEKQQDIASTQTLSTKEG